jgi:hypothetical protein
MRSKLRGAVVAVAVLAGSFALPAPAAHACPELDCTVACVMALVNNPKDPVCPA